MFTNLIDTERLIHSLKTVFACIAGFLLAKIIGVTADQWIIITIIVVMCAQLYVGSVMQKSYLRFLGTLIGCLFAAGVIAFFGSSFMTVLLGISISSFLFSYLATSQENLSYMGTLGAVTTIIILLGQTPSVTFAIERFLEISIGLMIATLVSQFVLPIHARSHLRKSQAATLQKLHDYYRNTIIINNIDLESISESDLDEDIVKMLIKQRQLAKDSVREPFAPAFDSTRFLQTLFYEREILRAITFMSHALSSLKNGNQEMLSTPALQKFNESVLQTLSTLINAIRLDNKLEEHIHVPPLQSLKQEMDDKNATLARKDMFYFDGFLFSAEILANSLVKLAEIYQVPVYNP